MPAKYNMQANVQLFLIIPVFTFSNRHQCITCQSYPTYFLNYFITLVLVSLYSWGIASWAKYFCFGSLYLGSTICIREWKPWLLTTPYRCTSLVMKAHTPYIWSKFCLVPFHSHIHRNQNISKHSLSTLTHEFHATKFAVAIFVSSLVHSLRYPSAMRNFILGENLSNE